MKRSVILTDRLDPDILLVLRVKGQVLYRERAHLKVPGCSLAPLIPTVLMNAFHLTNVSYFSRCHVTTNSVAPTLL